MNGLEARIAGPLNNKTIGTKLSASPINPNKLPAHPNPRFLKSGWEANGKNAPKLFRPSEAAESAEAAYFE